jgi:hypothetical protein
MYATPGRTYAEPVGRRLRFLASFGFYAGVVVAFVASGLHVDGREPPATSAQAKETVTYYIESKVTSGGKWCTRATASGLVGEPCP